MASQSDRNSTGRNHSTCLDLPARKRRIRRNKFRRRLEYFTRLAHTGLEAPVLWYCLSWSLRRCPVYASTGSQSPHLGIRCRFYRQPYMFTSGRGWKTVNIKSNISEQIPIVVHRQNLKKKKKENFLFLFIRNICDVKDRSLKAGTDLRQSEIYCLGAWSHFHFHFLTGELFSLTRSSYDMRSKPYRLFLHFASWKLAFVPPRDIVLARRVRSTCCWKTKTNSR